jgi:hypothetical protein
MSDVAAISKSVAAPGYSRVPARKTRPGDVPLQPGASYTVTVSIEVTEKKRVADQFSWSFRCGK